jgi:hypothetical protein
MKDRLVTSTCQKSGYSLQSFTPRSCVYISLFCKRNHADVIKVKIEMKRFSRIIRLDYAWSLQNEGGESELKDM